MSAVGTDVGNGRALLFEGSPNVSCPLAQACVQGQGWFDTLSPGCFLLLKCRAAPACVPGAGSAEEDEDPGAGRGHSGRGPGDGRPHSVHHPDAV